MPERYRRVVRPVQQHGGRTRGKQPADPPRPLSGPERRRAIRAALEATDVVAGDELARRFGVSRQAIVHDVAVLRAGGAPIVATVRGYLLTRSEEASHYRAMVAVRHGRDDAIAELTALVDAGVRVVDVLVEHPVYGELRASLHIGSRADVAAWEEATRRADAHLLSELTGGVHLHTLDADRRETLDRGRAALAGLGFLVDERPRPS